MLPTSVYAYDFTVLGVGEYQSSDISDLNNDDAYIFRNKLYQRNWSLLREYYDEDVWSTDFYTAGKESDMLYFTGHGSSTGKLILAQRYVDDAAQSREYATWADSGSSWTDLEFAIFAACDVLVRNEWGKPLAQGAHHILGYRDLSDDYTDGSIIDSFLNRAFGINRDYTKVRYAWKNANIVYDETDWAITGHKKNEDDYMLGVSTGVTSDVTGTDDIYHWYNGGSFYLDVPSIAPDATETSYKIGSIKKLGKLKVTSEEFDQTALAGKLLGSNYEIVTEKGGMPSDAYLAEVVPQLEVNADTKEETVTGYLFTYRHKHEDVSIQGKAGDSIKVALDNSGVSMYFRYWNRVKAKATGTEKDPVDAHKAVETAREDAKKRFKNDSVPNVSDVQLVYWSAPFVVKQDELRPAWRVTMGLDHIYVDAHTGEVINEGALMKQTGYLNTTPPQNPHKK